MGNWNSLLAGKTIDHVEVREVDLFGDREVVQQVLAFFCTDGTVVFGGAADGDSDRQYATFDPLSAQSFDEALTNVGEHARWYVSPYGDS